MSSMGNKVKIDIFGASHAPEIGMTLSGIPVGEKIDLDELYSFMLRRAPGRDATSTARKEPDRPIFLSGIENGITTGEEIKAVIKNTNQHSTDYDKLKFTPRPSHADYGAFVKYKGECDMRGGGPFSGRLTAPLCIGGGIAKQILERRGIKVGAHIYSIDGICDTPFDAVNAVDITAAGKKDFPVNSDEAGERMRERILSAKAEGDSVGGIVECAVVGLSAGYGGPLFDGVEGKISYALFGIPAVKGVEFGSGFECAKMRGSVHNDAFMYDGEKVVTKTNNAGGIAGGITSGMPLVVRAAFKPTPSIAKEQDTVNLETKENVKLTVGGRHDPCVVARAVPAVEAAVALAILDILEEN